MRGEIRGEMREKREKREKREYLLEGESERRGWGGGGLTTSPGGSSLGGGSGPTEEKEYSLPLAEESSELRLR